MKASVWIWQFSADYPAGTKPDKDLPIGTVLVKALDGQRYMSSFDRHPAAIAGPESVRKLADTYAEQGIGLGLWAVVYTTDETQARMLGELAAQLPGGHGIERTVVLDIEPQWWTPGATSPKDYCSLIRAACPDVQIGLCYDPRYPTPQASNLEDKLARIQFDSWTPYIDRLWPMCYWDAYAGQGGWGRPAECLCLAWLTVYTTDKPVIFVLPGAAPWEEMLQALTSPACVGADVSIFRRGIITDAVWEGLAGFAKPEPEPEPATPDEDRIAQLETTVLELEEQLNKLNGEVSAVVKDIDDLFQWIDTAREQITGVLSRAIGE